MCLALDERKRAHYIGFFRIIVGMPDRGLTGLLGLGDEVTSSGF